MVIIKIIFLIIILEIFFRVLYYLVYNKNYFVSLKLKWKDAYVVPHPFLSFSYKKNTVINKNQKLPYPIHRNKYSSFKNPLRINNLGHFGKDFKIKKDKIRVLCLGASTTANNISDGSRDYSYPLLLEKYLNDQSDENFEVLNCGIGGWTSVDVFINFVLNLIQLSPDYVILYHGYNDLHLYLMDDFDNDYQHGRKNLGEVLSKIKIANIFPKIKFLHSYEYIKDKIIGTGNVRNDVLKLITKNKIDYTNKYKDLTTQKNMIENLVIICKQYNIGVVLSSFAYYDHEKTLESNKIHQGISMENNIALGVSNSFNCSFVDQAKLIEPTDENFVDCIHFTPKGMMELANNFGKVILKNKKGTK
tara:strand:- start:20533 stop:21615 length:1083 start_codon:yes stop_codon:yes gene_type:complete